MSKITRFVLMMYAGVLTFGSLQAAASPAVPAVELAALGEAPPEFAAETAQAFLPLLDLSLPEMAKIKVLAEKEDWTGALDAYRDLLINHIKKRTRDETLGSMHRHWSASSPEDLLEGYLLIGCHADGISEILLGHPGAIDWFKVGVNEVLWAPEGLSPEVAISSDCDFCTHLSSMHCFIPLAEAYHRQPSGDLKYLKAWLGTWEDFARRHKAGYAEVQTTGNMNAYNSLGASQFQKLSVSWCIEEFWGQFACICQRLPENQCDEVSSVALAMILTELINNHVAIVARDISGVPNQAAHTVSAVLKSVNYMPGLKVGPVWSEMARAQVAEYYKTIKLSDGTNFEQAINYNKANPGLLVGMIRLYPDRPAWIRELTPYAELTLVYLASMLRNGSHPGALPRWGEDDRSEEKLLRGYLALSRQKQTPGSINHEK